jgi:hypothetical protein
MRRQGIADLSKITTAELDAYLVLLRRTDNGRAFLKIMRGFELTPGQASATLPELITSRPRRDLMPGTRPVTGPLRDLSDGPVPERRRIRRIGRRDYIHSTRVALLFHVPEPVAPQDDP